MSRKNEIIEFLKEEFDSATCYRKQILTDIILWIENTDLTYSVIHKGDVVESLNNVDLNSLVGILNDRSIIPTMIIVNTDLYPSLRKSILDAINEILLPKKNCCDDSLVRVMGAPLISSVEIPFNEIHIA